MKYEELTSVILECCFDVSNELGAGFLESVYERALIVALSQRGLEVRAQSPLKVKFRNVIVGDFYADLIVEGKVLIELKTVTRILSEHKAQVIKSKCNWYRGGPPGKFCQSKDRVLPAPSNRKSCSSCESCLN